MNNELSFGKQEQIKIRTLLSIAVLSMILFTGCEKDWLDAKPTKSLVEPKTIKDFQALLDNSSSNDQALISFNAQEMDYGEIGANDFYLAASTLQTLNSSFERNIHLWAGNIYDGAVQIDEWNIPYKKIFYANIVLEGIEIIHPDATDLPAWNSVKGSALFLRAYQHFQLAQIFCKTFDKTSSVTDPGIPLKLHSDIAEASVRGTVQQTYNQVINDLREAEKIMPDILPVTNTYKLRPTRAAVDAMLAKVYLVMEEYDSSLNYANKCLQQYDTLMNYSTFSTTSTRPFQKFNPEVIWHTTTLNYSSVGNGIVDSVLYRSYNSNDLRQKLFFQTSAGLLRIKGMYNSGSSFASIRFAGIATDEIYLIKAECLARKGDNISSMATLNTLLKKRWNSSFVPLTAATAELALTSILAERRRELISRGLRWTDLRRLNKDPRFAATLTRMINGQTYTLPPNDIRYVLPIPDNVIQLSGIAQNPR